LTVGSGCGQLRTFHRGSQWRTGEGGIVRVEDVLLCGWPAGCPCRPWRTGPAAWGAGVVGDEGAWEAGAAKSFAVRPPKVGGGGGLPCSLAHTQ
jgi:hypothetical protein